jgi:cell division protein FtsB
MEKDETYTKTYSVTAADIEEAQKARREKRAQALKSRRRKVKASKVEAEKARRSFITGRSFVLVCVSAAVAFFVCSSAFRIMDLKAQEKSAAEELKVKVEQKARLEGELSMLDDKGYIEEQARERLGMVKQGEVVYVFESTDGESARSGSGSTGSKGSQGGAGSGDSGSGR